MDITENTDPEDAWKSLRDVYGFETAAAAVFQLNRFGAIGDDIPEGLRLHLEDFGVNRLGELEDVI